MSDFSIVDKQICMALNRAWLPLDFRTVKKAISDITSINPQTGEAPFMFLDLVYAQNEDGSYNTDELINARPVSVDEWLKLEVRSCDIPINCGRYQLRAPTIIVATNYSKQTMRVPKFSAEGVWQRDGGRCQATGRKLTREEGDLGHDIARANGGQRRWENIALLDRKINRLQGTRSFSEMGWNIKPKAPLPRPVFFTLDDIKHPSHAHFVERN